MYKVDFNSYLINKINWIDSGAKMVNSSPSMVDAILSEKEEKTVANNERFVINQR